MSDQCSVESVQLMISGTTVINNHMSQIGGAIVAGCVRVIIGNNEHDYTEIKNNVASIRGGAIHSHHSCISTFSGSELDLSNNVAGKYGGGISFTGGVADGNYCNSILESQTDLSGNVANVHGGAVHVSFASYTNYTNKTETNVLSLLPDQISFYNMSWETDNVTSLIISNANINNTYSIAYGSGITIEYNLFRISETEIGNALPISVSITNSLFKNNHVINNTGGSAITYLAHHDIVSQLRIDNCIFEGNNELNFEGGFIWIELNICAETLLNVDENNCLCNKQYQDIIDVDFHISNSQFFGSSAIYGGAIYTKLPLTIEHSTFRNLHGIEGASIYCGCSSLLCFECIFSSNKCYGANGGVIFADYSELFVSNSIFENNIAESGGSAITIYNIDKLMNQKLNIYYDDLINIDRCKFINNIGQSAGSIYIPIVASQISTFNGKRLLLQDINDTDHDTDIIISDNLNNDDLNNDNFVIFWYENSYALDLSMASKFPNLPINEQEQRFEDICQLGNIDSLDLFISIDTVFEEINSFCTEFNDPTHTMILNWRTINETDSNVFHWVATKIDTTAEGCTANKIYSRTTTDKPISHGTYCFLSWITTDIYEQKTYHIKINKIYEWTPSFITISNSIFTNNSNMNGKGGAVTITSSSYIYEFTSVLIINSIFNSNSALFGGAIYRGLSITNYNKNETQMSVMEMNNITMYDNFASRNGGAIMVELSNVTKTDGILLKNVIKVENSKMINNMVGINGGAISVFGANMFVKDSYLSHSFGINGGCILVNHTTFTLYNTTLRECTALHEGGGLKHVVYHQYIYDLCFSMYYTNFIDNQAVHSGNDLYLELYGEKIVDGQRQSCMKVFDTKFNDNSSDSVSISILLGDHDILHGDRPFSNVCRNSNCVSDLLGYLCVSTIPTECDDMQNIKLYISNLTISGTPGELFIIYVFGWDVFGYRLNTSKFEIYVESDSVTVVNPAEITSADYGQFYNVPFVINEQQQDHSRLMTISDMNQIADDIRVEIIIEDCQDGYYKRKNDIDERYFTCELCGIGTYSMNNDECKICNEGTICLGGNNIKIKENWYAQLDDNDSYLHTALCAPRYCCTGSAGCSFEDKNSLCAANRDPNVLMCGACKPGFSETLSRSGRCNKCDSMAQAFWIVFIWMLLGFIFVYLLYYFGKKERRVPHPFITYVSRTLLFFYQILGFVIFKTSIPALTIMSELATLNFDFGKNGSCFFPNVTAREKLVMALVIPFVLLVDLFLLYLVLRVFYAKGKIKDWKNQMIVFQNTVNIIISVTYVQVVYSMTRLAACSQLQDGNYYMWYAGSVQCYDFGHILANILTVCGLLLPIGLYGVQRYYKYNQWETYEQLFAATILEYNEHSWYYSAFDLFRRGLLVIVPVISIHKEDVSFRTYMISIKCVILLIIHCMIMPYRWSINNHVETFAILMLCFCSLISIPYDASAWVDVQTYLLVCGLLPLVPFPFLFYEYSEEWFRNVFHKLKKITCTFNDNHDHGIYGSRMLSVNLKSRRISLYVADDEDDGRRQSLLSLPSVRNSKGATFTATRTRSGWAYPFKITKLFNLFTKSSKHQNTEFTVFIEGTLTFSRSIPSNTIIDIADIAQHLNYHTKYIGCQIDVKALFGGGTEFHLNFDCSWRNLNNLSDQLKDISPKLAMESSVIETLTDNESFLNDIIKSFKIKDQSLSNCIKITEFMLNGSFSDIDIDNILIEELLNQRAKDAKRYKTEISNLDSMPLHTFTKTNIADIIKSWVLNDIDHIARTEMLMGVLSAERLSGKKLVKLDNNLKIILEKQILRFMNEASFNKILKYLQNKIAEDPQFISTKGAPEIGCIISDFSLNILCKYIIDNNIHGGIVSNYHKTGNQWIKERTNWNEEEIYQINEVVWRHITETPKEINKQLLDALEHQFGKITADTFCKQITNINLSELQLKIRNGKSIISEAEIIMNVVEELQNDDTINDHKVEETSNRTNTVLKSGHLVQDIYGCVAQCLKIEDHWVCFNCGNHNFQCFIAGRLHNDLTICRLCGLNQLSSMIWALKAVDTYYVSTITDQTDIHHQDEQLLINVPHNDENINITCPNSIDKSDCKSMIRLCKKVIFYQTWLNKIRQENGNSDIALTTSVDLHKLDNKSFHKIVIHSAQQLKKKINDEQIDRIRSILKENIINIDTFCDLSRRAFVKTVSKNTKIKPGICTSFYKNISKSAKKQAQNIGFG
eukprot:117898_1